MRIERMLTRSEADKAGQERASKIGASSLAELRAKPADEIQRGIQGGRLVIDGWYVTEDISVTIAEGRHNRVDLLIGSNKDEGTFVSLYPTSPFFGLGNASARQFADSASQRFGSKASAFLEVYPAGSEEQAKESQLAPIRDEAAWNARDWAMAQAKAGEAALTCIILCKNLQHRPGGRQRAGARHMAQKSRTHSIIQVRPGRKSIIHSPIRCRPIG